MSDPVITVENDEHVHGVCRPLSVIMPSYGTLARSAGDFARPVALNTNKAESQWLGSLLLYLSASGGEWKAVPWRMLRNAYMGYDAATCLAQRNDVRLPRAVSITAPVVYVAGSGLPIEELLIGYSHMLAKGLVKTFSGEQEDYLIPTDNLLSCVRKLSALPYDEVVYGPVVHIAPLA